MKEKEFSKIEKEIAKKVLQRIWDSSYGDDKTFLTLTFSDFKYICDYFGVEIKEL